MGLIPAAPEDLPASMMAAVHTEAQHALARVRHHFGAMDNYAFSWPTELVGSQTLTLSVLGLVAPLPAGIKKLGKASVRLELKAYMNLDEVQMTWADWAVLTHEIAEVVDMQIECDLAFAYDVGYRTTSVVLVVNVHIAGVWFRITARESAPDSDDDPISFMLDELSGNILDQCIDYFGPPGCIVANYIWETAMAKATVVRDSLSLELRVILTSGVNPISSKNVIKLEAGNRGPSPFTPALIPKPRGRVLDI